METTAMQARGPITHELKCHPEPFQAVKDGRKPFEWRKDDRDYRVGDTLWLREWYPGDTPSIPDATAGYTGESIKRKVTYIIREGFGIPDGYCIMGLAELDKSGEGEVRGTGMVLTDEEAWKTAHAAALDNRQWIEDGDKTDAFMRGFLYARYRGYLAPSKAPAGVVDPVYDFAFRVARVLKDMRSSSALFVVQQAFPDDLDSPSEQPSSDAILDNIIALSAPSALKSNTPEHGN